MNNLSAECKKISLLDKELKLINKNLMLSFDRFFFAKTDKECAKKLKIAATEIANNIKIKNLGNDFNLLVSDQVKISIAKAKKAQQSQANN